VKKYESSLNEEAGSFKDTLVENISSYIDEYIDEKIPVNEIEEAVKNKKATAVLESLRSTLGVDFALAKNTIRDAIHEGKETIDKSHGHINVLQEQNNQLASKVEKLSTHILLTEKAQDLPEEKRSYVFKVLSDKDTQFITENFDYTVRLFDKTEQDRLTQIKQEAVAKRPAEVDRPIVEQTRTTEKPVEDKVSSPFVDSIMSELGKF
jgi:cell division protein FtsB